VTCATRKAPPFIGTQKAIKFAIRVDAIRFGAFKSGLGEIEFPAPADHGRFTILSIVQLRAQNARRFLLTAS